MRFYKHSLLISFMAAFTASAQTNLVPIFPADVQVHAEKALAALNMTMADARFEKNHGKPSWTLSWITNTLNDPWALPGVAEKIFQSAESTQSAAWWNLSAELLELSFVDPPSTEPVALNAPVGLDDVLAEFTHSIAGVRDDLARAFAEVDATSRVYLAAGVFSPVYETEDVPANREILSAAGISRDAQERVERETHLLDATEVSLAALQIMHRVDLSELLHAAMKAQSALTRFKQQTSFITNWPDQIIMRETSAGRIIIGTKGTDVFSGPALLVLDPGGHDTYRDGVGAANGLLDHPVAAIIDLSGDDQYRSSGLLGAGSALWGISFLLDDAGDDEYNSSGTGAGAAIYGAGWLEDARGKDRYAGRAIGQGAGITGFGFLIDHAGDDQYDIGLYGQGFSGVKGWGLLLDRAGNDRYFAGNMQLDHERNDTRYLSLSQGFSIGMRPHAGGGVAALVDLAGNDTYTADIYGQGVSYYYSAGFLLDHAGHDRYSMYQYGQGCGIHLSLGLLADANGDDFYTGYILAQGAAHDYAVGMLFDHAGNDTYTADHHSQGRALNNSFAMLVDRAGDDAFFGRQREQAQGIGNSAGHRDYGSLALLLDLGGTDVYSGGFSNRTITLRPLYGTVYDYEESKSE